MLVYGLAIIPSVLDTNEFWRSSETSFPLFAHLRRVETKAKGLTTYSKMNDLNSQATT